MSRSRRVLITGLSSHWGGRLAQQLERDREVVTLVGVDEVDPRHALERTEFVRVGTDDGLLRRIVNAAAIDTVIDTRLIGDPLVASLGQAHEINVTGTHSILDACAGSSVRKLVFKSSAHYYGAEHGDPSFFTEEMARSHPPRTAIEEDIVAAEEAVQAFAVENPEMTVTVVRFAPAVGGELRASHLGLLNLPVVPAILGFDPRWQFIHEEDVVRVLTHVARHDLPGVYNAAADGVLALSEVVSLLGKTLLPVLPPWGMVFTAMQLRRLGLRVPVELLRELRYGRGLDNRRLKAAGFSYRYTSREAIQKLRAQQRLRPLLRSGSETYRYEREVEEFLRRSPSVVPGELGGGAPPPRPAAAGNGEAAAGADEARAPADGAGADASGPRTGANVGADGSIPERAEAYDALSEGDLLDLLPSLDRDALELIQAYESAHGRRAKVLNLLARQLDRRTRSGAN